MFREIAASISGLINGRLSTGIRTRRASQLNVDELSEHMLRDLGLADGHARPFEDAGVREIDRAPRQEQFVLTPFAS